VRKKTIKVYEKFVVVEGSGEFPLDMLRYDSAFPATEIDSSMVVNRSNLRAVALIVRSVNDLGPTSDRWRSFTWRVVGIFDELYSATQARDAVNGRNKK
jgi:hypothetical protein